MKTKGKIKMIDGSECEYILLSATFPIIPRTRKVLFVEFWQEPNKNYLTGIASNAVPPIHAKFVFSKGDVPAFEDTQIFNP